MAKNTGKKRKRKNVRLHRTVRKTIAAIFMIMAVVVAAIPVEQLGTMQAKTTDVRNLDIKSVFEQVYNASDMNIKMESVLTSYNSLSDATSYKSDATPSAYTVKFNYTDTAATYLKEFAIASRQNKNDEAVILKYVGDEPSAAIDLNKKRYTSYFIITQAYVDAVETDVLKKETYTAHFADDDSSVSEIKDKDNNQYKIPKKLMYEDGKVTFSDTRAGSKKITANGKKYFYSVGEIKPETVVKNYASIEYAKRITEIQNYNTAIDNLTRLAATYDSTQILQALKDAGVYNDAGQYDETKYNSLKNFNVSYMASQAGSSNVDDPKAFLKDSIIDRFCADDSSFSLRGFTLLDLKDEVTDASSNTSAVGVYVPRYSGTMSNDDPRINKITEDNFISFESYVTITGIGNNAFSKIGDNATKLEISSLTLSDKVEFIGNGAFNKQTSLNTVELAYCKVIGNDAFSDCVNLNSVTFGSESGNQSTGVLGARAFYNCTKLKGITFPKELKTIGTACFAKSGLTSFGLSSTSTTGGAASITLTIWPFAFYNCANLSGDTSAYFNNPNVNVVIGMGAFAVGEGGNTLTSFKFPDNYKEFIASKDDQFGIKNALKAAKIPGADVNENTNTEGEVYYDYILAGRTALETVTFPGSLNTCKIPDNTLMGCPNLGCVIFGEASYREDGSHCQGVYFDSPNITGDKYEYDTDSDGEYLFQDITNKNFYVKGPGFQTDGKSLTKLRSHTKAAKTAVSEYVPYVYLNESNNEQIEATYGDYVATVVINPDGTATLKSYDFVNNSKSTIRKLEVPSTIAGYKVTQLGTDCFGGVKNHIIELTIADDSITTIEEGALKDAEMLARVNIGNSVTSIGKDAFAGCTKLENVHFSEPVSDGTDMTIGSGAFKTNSNYLTFHGKVEEGYAPYDYAMDSDETHFTSKAAKRNICYQVDSPVNIKVLLDNATLESTLVDYPHFEEIDLMNADLIESLKKDSSISNYSIIKKFNVNQEWETDSAYNTPLTQEENDVVMAALLVDIPKGIESLDAKTYFGVTDNKDNWDYLTLTHKESDAGIDPSTTLNRELNAGTPGQNDPVKLYSDETYPNDIDTPAAGLFSGNFREKIGTVKFFEEGNVFKYSLNENFNNQEYSEGVTAGNDILTAIGLGSIKQLPDYAFYSCENLLSVKVGSEMNKMEKIPFRGCVKLTGIEPEEGSVFFSDNAIIYQKGDSTSRAAAGRIIIECLESRGDLNSPELYRKSVIATDNDPELVNVTDIAEEAFAYNTGITHVDLSDTQVTAIPEGCFMGDTRLKTVILPDTTTSIGKNAFSGTTADVYINNPACTITDAFDKNYNGVIYGYKYSDEANNVESPAYKYAQSLKNATFKEIGYVVTFESDGKVYEVQNVNAGKAATKPTDPTKTGYKFKYWQWTDSNGTVHTGTDAYSGVNENRKVVAVFEPGNGVVSDGKTYTMTVTGGTGNGSTSLTNMTGGAIVVLEATGVSTTQSFQYWSATGTDSAGVTADCSELIGDVHSASTSMYMPNANVTVTAHYTTNSTGGGSGSGGSGSGGSGSGGSGGSGSGSSSDSTTKYKLTVNYGSGSGEYTAGQVVTISAFAPESSSKVFSKWTSTTAGVGFANASAASTTITMPATEATVTANYKTRTSDDDEDDSDAANRRKGTTTTTTTVANGTNNAQNTTTTTTTTNGTTTSTTTQGDRLSIDKTGISNKDVGSTTVEGATDNFIVKVSDSDSAVAEAQAALMNKFGSLDGIVYMPMDISLYDSTGKNKIQDTTGLNVNITIPIPDEMIQYGGNVHMAAIENSQLQDLNVKFTTIDGIACMSFTAPHFSPYVAYVDTQNLVAGQMLDATPKTGDPIHPKWFLAAGMACLSIILFASGDKKRKIKIA